MYSNIGGKIKKLAVIIAILMAAGSVISGIIVLSQGYGAAAGVINIILGPIIAWVLSLTIYGFGELIEHTTEIRNTLYTINRREEKK
jgi:hypothetical protein